MRALAQHYPGCSEHSTALGLDNHVSPVHSRRLGNPPKPTLGPSNSKLRTVQQDCSERADAQVLKTLVHLKDETLLRVQHRRFRGRYAVQGGIKALHVREEPAIGRTSTV